jgi:hypothetical protein
MTRFWSLTVDRRQAIRDDLGRKSIPHRISLVCVRSERTTADQNRNGLLITRFLIPNLPPFRSCQNARTFP